VNDSEKSHAQIPDCWKPIGVAPTASSARRSDRRATAGGISGDALAPRLRWLTALTVLAVAAIVTQRAVADDRKPGPGGSQRGPSYLALTAGSGEVLGSDRVFVFGAEYRFRQHLFHIHPYLHGSWTSHGAGYLGAGLLYTFKVAPHWHAAISSGPGYYRHGNFWKDLGHKLEFF
jgi:hypothetical protein